MPISVDGRDAVIRGTFWRVREPVGVAVARGAAVLHRCCGCGGGARRGWRSTLTVALGTAAGLGALVAITTFAARDAPNGRVAWLQIAAGVVVGAVLAVLLVVLHDGAAFTSPVSLGGSPRLQRSARCPSSGMES